MEFHFIYPVHHREKLVELNGKGSFLNANKSGREIKKSSCDSRTNENDYRRNVFLALLRHGHHELTRVVNTVLSFTFCNIVTKKSRSSRYYIKKLS